MRELIRNIIRSEKGYAVIIIFLLTMPVLLAAMEGVSSSSTSVFSADVDLQEAAAFAVKSAASSVVPGAQANGKPRINPAMAHTAFRDTLARNIGLNPATMAPLSNSAYSTPPRYWLVVYNGYDDYAQGARMFYFDGTTVTESGFPYGGFPAKFAVSQSGITSGAGGVRTVTLESPGVVALVVADARKIIGQGDISSWRWAAARVVCKEGTCRVN